MRRNPYYILSEIGESFYLVPFGQAIELCAPSVRVTEAAAFIWDHLDECGDVRALAGLLAEEYKVSPEEYASMEADVAALVRSLRNMGLVLDEEAALEAAMTEIRGDSDFSGTSETSAGEVEQPLRRPQSSAKIPGEIPVQSDTDSFIPVTETPRIIKIAGITIRFHGKSEFFSDNFKTFCVDTDCSSGEDCAANKEPMCDASSVQGADFAADSGISVIVTDSLPPKTDNSSPVIRGMTVTVDDAGDRYIMRSSETPLLAEAHIRKDGGYAVFYMGHDPACANPEAPVSFSVCQKDSPSALAGKTSPDDIPDTARKSDIPAALTAAECVFHTVRHVFLLKAQTLGMYVIHSASILYDGHAWLFSALSGTGKSTHTNLWHRLYGTPYLNGDLNLLAFEDGKPVVKGIPWCGTSGICTTKTYPLGGILLLARDEKNYVEELPSEAQILGIQMRFISPKWTEEQAADSLAFAARIAESARVARLHCTMDDEAAAVCRAFIDGV